MGENWRYNQQTEESWRDEQGTSSWRDDVGIQPPHNPELRLAIERLAEYVAKNGPQFEQMTRDQQRNNPKFAFLFGGPSNEYYRYCVDMNLRNKAHDVDRSREETEISQEDQEAVTKLKTQIEEYRANIQQSEQNLVAHKNAIPLMKDTQLKAYIVDAETAKVSEMMTNVKLDIRILEQQLDVMNSSKCSKETVSICKKWIFEHCQTDQLREMILNYLLNRVKNSESTENFRLHVLYIINDWAYYCQRKKLHNQTQMLSRYVPQLYAFNVEMARDGVLQNKLEKIVGVWEAGKYFSDQCFKQLRNTTQIVGQARAVEHGNYMKVAESIEQTLQAAYDGYEMQHNSYAAHCQQRIDQMEQQIQAIYDRVNQRSLNQPPPSLMSIPTNQIGGRKSKFDQRSRGSTSFDFLSGPRHSTEVSHSMLSDEQDRWMSKQIVDGDDIDGTPFNEQDLRPTKSYIELPAGVMVSLVPTDSFTYEPIRPDNIELPPNLPPSQKLLAANNEFYMALEQDSQEMLDGIAPDDWDLTHYPKSYLERKEKSKKDWMNKIMEKGKSVEDMIKNRPNKQDLVLEESARRKYEEKEVELIKQEVDAYYETQDDPIPDRLRVRLAEKREPRSRSSSRSSDGSPSHGRRSRRKSRSRSYSSSRSRSSSESDSDSDSSSSSSSKSSRGRSVSRSPERVPFKRSPSPEGRFAPSFSTPAMPLGADNKGAQLMQKMGWSGKGLGSKESGIVNPVDGGEIRDRMDQFKGLGKKEDLYEAYRKQRAGYFRDKGAQRAFGNRDQ